MKALSDPGTVKSIKMLQGKSMRVCELRAAEGTARPIASNPLKIFEDTGLLGQCKSVFGTNRHFANGEDSPCSATMPRALIHRLEDGLEIIRLVNSLPAIHREEIRKKTLSPAIENRCSGDNQQEERRIREIWNQRYQNHTDKEERP
jgi:ArsR family transcriptional regulator